MQAAESQPVDGCLWYPQAPSTASLPLQHDLKVDALIVGAGYCGLAAAAVLRARGVETAVVDAREIGGGASGRNGGQLVPGFKIGPNGLRRLYGQAAGDWLFNYGQRAPDVVEALVSTHGIDCDLQRNGWIKAAHSARALAKLRNECAELQQVGASVRLLDCDEMVDYVGASTYHGGLLFPHGGTLNPYAYCLGLARAAINAGATIHPRTPALSMRREGSVWVVRTPAATIRADRVAVATDGYTEGLLPALARCMIRVGSYQIATAPLPRRLLTEVVRAGVGVSDTRVLLRYFRITTDGRLVMGGRGAFADRSDPSLYKLIENSIKDICPGLNVGAITSRWHGMVALTRDSLPHIFSLGEKLLFAGGFNGRGVAMATAFGQSLARAMLDEPDGNPLVHTPLKPYSWHALRIPTMALGARMLGLRERILP